MAPIVKNSIGRILAVFHFVMSVICHNIVLYCPKMRRMYDHEIHGRIIAIIAILHDNSMVVFAVHMFTGFRLDKRNHSQSPTIANTTIFRLIFLICFFIRKVEAKMSPKKNHRICLG